MQSDELVKAAIDALLEAEDLIFADHVSPVEPQFCLHRRDLMLRLPQLLDQM